MLKVFSVLMALAVPGWSLSAECPGGTHAEALEDGSASCVPDGGTDISGAGNSSGGAGLSQGSGPSGTSFSGLNDLGNRALGGGTGGGLGSGAAGLGAGTFQSAVGGQACAKPFPAELLDIKFQHHASFRQLDHDRNGHGILPVKSLPAGHKVGFHANSGRGGRMGGGMVAIFWSPGLGLEYPENCAWTIWIATEKDPRPACNCWSGPARANPHVPISRSFYTGPFPEGKSSDALRAKSCVLKGDENYFFYFAASGNSFSKRCTAMLASGAISVAPRAPNSEER